MLDQDTSIKLLAQVMFNQVKDKHQCKKFQFTNYGKCSSCPDKEDCKTLTHVMNARSVLREDME